MHSVLRVRAEARKRGAAAALAHAAPIFAALGDATRLGIVKRLCDDGPLSIARLAEGTAVSRQAIAKHLRALEDAGLVHSDRAGRERICALRTRGLAEVRRYLDEISGQWDGALARLRRFVESEPR
jgi:DNA-binding transcriptional ArsR family regulator